MESATAKKPAGNRGSKKTSTPKSPKGKGKTEVTQALTSAQKFNAAKKRLADAATAAGAAMAESIPLNKRLAETIVALRLTIIRNGRPDYRGWSQHYRDTFREVMAAAIPDEVVRDEVKRTVGYHISNRLHEVVSADELRAVGLKTESQKTRKAKRNAKQTQTRKQTQTPSVNGDAPHNPSDAAQSALLAVRAVRTLIAADDVKIGKSAALVKTLRQTAVECLSAIAFLTDATEAVSLTVEPIKTTK